ncbi:MAG: CRISPR-associated protein Cas5, partial [Planctomycetia bacterium]|nr:CRISPR-associated protein Cas5 [Planctomycetia bacterium]
MNQKCFLSRILRFSGTSIFAFIFTFTFSETVNAENEKPTGKKPAIFWVSSPIEGGETGIICGGNFTPDAQVQVTAKYWRDTEDEKCAEIIEKTHLVKPLRMTETSIFFRMPTGSEAELTVICAAGKTEPFYVNRPEVWWIQGDQGRKATAKTGWITVNTNIPGKMRKLTIQKTDSVDSEVDSGSDSVSGSVSDSDSVSGVVSSINNIHYNSGDLLPLYEITEPGIYTVLLDGRNVGTIEIVPHTEFYRPECYDVTDFGAIPNDGMDDTHAFLAALEKIRENDGGILYVPRGRFQVRDTLELPPYSALIGETYETDNLLKLSAEETLSGAKLPSTGPTPSAQIYWPDTS